MRYVKAFAALPKGLQLCLSDSTIRRFALWPWVIGIAAYLTALYAALRLHPILLHAALGDPAGWLMQLIFWGAWVVFALLLFLGAGVFTVMIVMVLAAVFQTSIALAALQTLGEEIPHDQSSGFSALAKETTRSLGVELLKLLWLVPLLAVLLLAGLIPLLAPFALLLGSWLLAFQFVDLILDIYKLTAWQRLKFSLQHFLLLACFGLALTLAWAIPFAGVILVPPAQAGAVWLLSGTGLLPPKLD